MKKLMISVCALFAAATIGFAQDVNEATDIFNSAVEYLNLGDKVTALDKFREAYSLANACGEPGENIVSQCKETIPQLALMVAKDFVKAGDYASAVTKANEAIEIAKELESDSVVAQATALVPNIYMQQGNVLLKAKDFDGAIAAYQNTLALNPTNGKAYLNMAVAYDKNAEYAKAEETYLLAAANGQEKAANKSLANIYLKKAVSANKAHNYEDAIKFAEKSNSFNENSKAYYVAGLAAQSAGFVKDAIKYFEKYLDLEPSASNSQDVRTVVEGLKKVAK